MKNNTTLFVVCFLMSIGFGNSIKAQNLLEKLEAKYPEVPQYELATFKASRISIGHSVETRKKGVLEIQTFSRFWKIPNFDAATRSQSLVADKMSTRIALE